MESLSNLIDWANRNEGFLQALAMLGGISALAFSLFRQRTSGALSREKDAIPARVTIGPVSANESASVVQTLTGYGGDAVSGETTVVASFDDVDDAARAALAIQRRAGALFGAIVTEPAVEVAEVPEQAAGTVLTTNSIHRALAETPDVRVREGGFGPYPFAISSASGKASWARWALPAVGVALVLVAVGLWLRPAPADEMKIRSIAVLPLDNLSGDPTEDAFADGMTEAITGELARIASLRVISRTSTLHLKQARKSLREIADELQVDAVIEGSILRVGDEVRINAQLIRLSTEDYLWAQDYRRDLQDVLRIQKDIALSVANAVEARVTEMERVRFSRTEEIDPRAFEEYLNGRTAFARRTEPEFQRAIRHFENAIQLAPDFAAAHAGLAATLVVLPGYGLRDPIEIIQLVNQHASRAIEIDDSEALAWAVLTELRYRYEWDWKGADEAGQKALALNPNLAVARHWYAMSLIHAGRIEEGLAQMQIAKRLDPVPAVRTLDLGLAYYYARDFATARQLILEAISKQPDLVLANILLANLEIHEGNLPEALEAAQRATHFSSRHPFSLVTQARVEWLLGTRSEAEETISEALADPRIEPFAKALAFTTFGESERAARAWREALEAKSPYLVALGRSPTFDDWQEDASVREIIEIVGAPRE